MTDSVREGITDGIRNAVFHIRLGEYITSWSIAFKDFLGQIDHKASMLSNAATAAANAQARPSVLYKPTLSFFGPADSDKPRKYCATYGECMGIGKTPAEAMADFDAKWGAA